MAAVKTASTDPWPTQTDEDIDRLVALHKVRIIIKLKSYSYVVCDFNLGNALINRTTSFGQKLNFFIFFFRTEAV